MISGGFSWRKVFIINNQLLMYGLFVIYVIVNTLKNGFKSMLILIEKYLSIGGITGCQYE